MHTKLAIHLVRYRCGIAGFKLVKFAVLLYNRETDVS